MIKRPVSISWSAKKDLNTTNFVKMVGDYVCNMCGKQFMAKKGLSDHNWAVHEQVESPCNFCDKIFRSKKHLAVHISNTHAENPRFSCDFKSGEIACIYYSTTKSNLTAHKKRVHEKTMMTDDPKCGGEAAENDRAPEQLSLEMNKWIAINLLIKIRSFSAFVSLNLYM